jgi:hypothetical protein
MMETIVVDSDEESEAPATRPNSDSEDVDVAIIEDDMNLDELMRQKVATI